MFQKPNDRAGGRLRLGLLLSLSLSFAFAWLAFLTGQAALAQDADAWQTYTSDDAAYAFDIPPGALLSTSEDASLRYKIVYVQLPTTDTTEYQGVSVMVLENETGAPLSDFVAARYAAAGAPSEMARPALSAQQVDGRAAVRLDRDMVVGDGDSATVLVPGDGVVYRINLYGGGVGGPTEPSPQAQAMFERMVASFRVLPAPKTPRALEAPGPSAQAAEPEAATVFTYPMRSGAGVQYGVPVGIVVADTHLEWLGYAIRNLDQWRMKCYGVDWARMIHTGEDWYRLDGANSVGTPVYAVADGVVARHNPGISYPGNVVLIRHRLPDGRNLYSMYGHVANVRVVAGQAVVRGQQIATVLAQNYTGRTPRQHPTYDAHLHFEMRFFLDGSNIYVPSTNAYGYNYPSCTWLYPGRGYTYRIHPDAYPYPSAGLHRPD